MKVIRALTRLIVLVGAIVFVQVSSSQVGASCEVMVAAKDVACVQAANARKRQCDAGCQELWGTDCVNACESDADWVTAGACISLCQRTENKYYADCIGLHNAEVAQCPERRS